MAAVKPAGITVLPAISSSMSARAIVVRLFVAGSRNVTWLSSELCLYPVNTLPSTVRI